MVIDTIYDKWTEAYEALQEAEKLADNAIQHNDFNSEEEKDSIQRVGSLCNKLLRVIEAEGF